MKKLIIAMILLQSSASLACEIVIIHTEDGPQTVVICE
jgi:hypothetical protein